MAYGEHTHTLPLFTEKITRNVPQKISETFQLDNYKTYLESYCITCGKRIYQVEIN